MPRCLGTESGLSKAKTDFNALSSELPKHSSPHLPGYSPQADVVSGVWPLHAGQLLGATGESLYRINDINLTPLPLAGWLGELDAGPPMKKTIPYQ